MKRVLLAAAGLGVAFVLAGAVTRAQDNVPTTAPSSDAGAAQGADAATPPPAVPLPPGMTPIFDGKTLDGWKQIPGDSWTVKDGAIVSLGIARGVLYTASSYDRYRMIFDMRHISGNKDHQACVLVFCTTPTEDAKPLDALSGIQFQVPNGGHWDYRKGHNNGGKGEFTNPIKPKFNVHEWSRVEILVDPASGTARMAVAQPVGTKAIEVLDFKEPTAGQKGPFALQMHNKGLFDEYANIAIQENPTGDELITTK